MAISGGDAILGRAAVLLGAEIDPKFATEAERGILGPLQKIASHATAILAGAFVAHKLFDFLKESAKLAAEDEHSIHLLEFALDALQVSAADQAGAEKWIEQMERARGVMDDELRPALAQAARFTQDLTKAEDLLGLAQDISIGRGLPLINVVTALGKAYTGNVAQLQRLGLAIKDSTGHALTSKEAFEKLFQQFGGLGESAMETAEGRARGLNVAIDEMKEQVGRLLLPVLMQFADILINDIIPPIRSVIGFLGDLNGLTDGWGGKVLAASVAATALAFALSKVVAIGAAIKLFLATTISQLGTGAAVAASYAGGLVSTVAGSTAAGGAAAGASVAFEAEQLSLFGVVPAAEAAQLSLFGVAEAETAAAAAARANAAAQAGSKAGMLGALLPIAVVAAAGIGLGYVLNKVFGDTSHSVKQLTQDLQSLSVEANAAKLQSFVDGIDQSTFAAITLHKSGFDLLHKDFEKILKDTPQFAQQFLNVAASLKGGKEGTAGWQAEIDKTAASIKKANAAGTDWQAQIDGTTGLIDEQSSALAELVNQTGAEAIAMTVAAGFSDVFHESMERGKKANEEHAQSLVDHAKAYDELVDAIGPVAAAITTTGNTTTDQLTQMASDALQFASDFASALHDATDSISFFAGQTAVSADQLQQFLVKSLAATVAWTANLQYAVAIGIDKGYLQELAKAGPKAAPILQALLDLVTKTSVSATNELLRGVSGAQAISRNLWSGFVADAAAAARRLSIELRDVQTQTGGALARISGGAPPPPPMVPFPTLDSLGLGKAGGVGAASSSAIERETDAVAESLKRLQDQFKIGEITEQQLADQAGSMWAQTEKFSSSWMAIWEILNQNAVHIQDASDKAGKAAQDAADQAAKAAQEAADKAAKAAADAAEKIAEAAARAAAEYTDAFNDVVAVLGKYGATVLKTRGLSTEQLKAMASEIKSFQSAVASSFASAASAVAAFGNQTEVTGQQLLDFQRQSLRDARDWARNITLLMQMGLDPALLSPLAEAGPKAGNLVRAYIDEIGLIGVNAVNQMAKDQAAILAQTTAVLTAGITGTPTSQFVSSITPPTINSQFTVQGSVYGVADLNAYMDQRDAQLAATIAAGYR